MLEKALQDFLTGSRKDASKNPPVPCTPEQIKVSEVEFQRRFGVRFPDAYKQVLRASNGLLRGPMMVWPAVQQVAGQETVFNANEDLQEVFAGKFLVFGSLQSNLYGLDVENQVYCAKSFPDGRLIEKFSSDARMFEILLLTKSRS